MPIASDIPPYKLWALELASVCAANLTDYGLESTTDGAASSGSEEYSLDGKHATCHAALRHS